MFIGSLIVIVLIAYVKGAPLVPERIIDMFNREPYLASYAEVVGTGGLPLLISIIRRDDPRIYGPRKQGLFKSLVLSLSFAIVMLVITIHDKLYFENFNLEFPYNIWYAVLGVLAYGPLEVFFVIWLIVNTDAIFSTLEKIFSPGLLITVLVFGLSHIFLSPMGGLLNAVKVTGVFMVLGFIFKYTRNSIGPMIARTLVNGQVLRLLIGCLT